MSWKTALSRVDWSQLRHAYGAADDVPELLERLTQEDDAADAAGNLWASVLHQGGLFSATAPTVEVLALQLVARVLPEPELAWLLLHTAAEALPQEGYEDYGTRRALRNAAAVLRPLLDDPDQAGDAAWIISLVGPLAPADQQRIEALASERPVTDAAIVAVAALTRHGIACNADAPELALSVAITRLIQRRETQSDVALVGTNLEQARQVFDLVPRLDKETLIGRLVERNPRAVPTIAALAEPDAELAAGLVHAMGSSRGATTPENLALALDRISLLPPERAVPLLIRLPQTPQTRDALHAAAEAAPPQHLRCVANAAYRLATADDPRWEQHLSRVLDAREIGSYVQISWSKSTPLTYALSEINAVPSDDLRFKTGQVIMAARTDQPDILGGLLTWVGSWPHEAAAQLHEQIVAVAPVAPIQAAIAMRRIGDVGDAAVLRGLPADDESIRLHLARLTGELDDWLDALRWGARIRSELLAEFPEPKHPEFLAWCQAVLGEETDRSFPARADQVAALDRLVAADALPIDRAWPRLVELIGLPGTVDTAAALAIRWVDAGRLTPEAHATLDELLEDRTRNNYPETPWYVTQHRLAAAVAWRDLRGHWPAEPELAAEIIAESMTPIQSPTALALARALDGPARQAAATALTALLRQDERFSVLGFAIEGDEAACQAIREALADEAVP